MDATHYILLFCLIWHYCYLKEVSPECNKALFNDHVKPINLSVNISERILDLYWDCLFPPEIKSKMEYRIYLKHDDGYDYKTKTRKCDTKITLEILSDVCLKVIPAIKNEECEYLSSEKCVNLERHGTSAENVSCRVYNTSSMTCTWMFGKNAPHSTSYILFLRQETTSLQCQQYEIDFQARTGACTFHDLRVNFFDDTTIVLQGLDPGIEVFEDEIQLAQIEILNPPRDISVTSFNDSIAINWESPQIQYSAEDRCFQYMIEMNKNSQHIPRSSPFTIPNLEKECSVRIRARGNDICEMNTHWGEWSESITCGPRPTVGKNAWKVELIPVILISALILTILIITTLQYKRIVDTCFPRIPQPKNYLESTEDCKINTEHKDWFSPMLPPMLPKFETEECIVIKKKFSCKNNHNNN